MRGGHCLPERSRWVKPFDGVPRFAKTAASGSRSHGVLFCQLEGLRLTTRTNNQVRIMTKTASAPGGTKAQGEAFEVLTADDSAIVP